MRSWPPAFPVGEEPLNLLANVGILLILQSGSAGGADEAVGQQGPRTTGNRVGGPGSSIDTPRIRLRGVNKKEITQGKRLLTCGWCRSI